MARVARLIITFDCNRNCVNCCSKDESTISKAVHIKDINALGSYDQIIITGGEPMFYPDFVVDFARHFKGLGATVCLYTAMCSRAMVKVLSVVDGVHFTLHAPLQPGDTVRFNTFQELISRMNGSYRLYIDPAITEPVIIRPNLWKRVEVKPWILEGQCPLPEGETLFILDEMPSIVNSSSNP